MTFQSVGLEEVYRGHEGVRRSLQAWNEIWTERSFRVREVLDGGDTWLRTHRDVSCVVRLDPLIVDFRNFTDDAEALREAGFT